MCYKSRLDSDDVETGEPNSPWMKAVQTASYLGISVGTLRNWTSARYVPFSRRGRIVRYNRGSLDRWLSKGSCPGRSSIADISSTTPRPRVGELTSTPNFVGT